MRARYGVTCLKLAAILAVLASTVVCPAEADDYSTHAERGISTIETAEHSTARPVGNFTVLSPNAEFSRRVLTAAESYRRQLARDWFGAEMPEWSAPCPIYVTFARGNGGNTSFTFDKGEVFGWHMAIQGTPDGIVHAVLPHEVLHTVFASHFRQSLPRWADEGACSTIEPTNEKKKLHLMLGEFLQTGRGIPFSKMVAMRDYPSDIMPVYAQGESVADFLLQHDGKQHYTRFLASGIKSRDWPSAVRTSYGYRSLGQLQTDWLTWYKAGSPRNTDLTGERHSVGYG